MTGDRVAEINSEAIARDLGALLNERDQLRTENAALRGRLAAVEAVVEVIDKYHYGPSDPAIARDLRAALATGEGGE